MTQLNQPFEAASALNQFCSAMDRFEVAVEPPALPTFSSDTSESDRGLKLVWVGVRPRTLMAVLAALPPMRPKTLKGTCVDESLHGHATDKSMKVEPVWINLAQSDCTCPLGMSGLAVEWVTTVNNVPYEIQVRIPAYAVRYWTVLNASVIASSTEDGELETEVMGFTRSKSDPLAFPVALRFLRETLFD